MSKQRRTVLLEEEYTSTLTSIVQREYFPDLPNLEKQSAVLSRRQVQDFKGAVAVRRAARRLKDHEEASALREESNEAHLDGEKLRITARPLHRETVTGFHARVTSEDNHEFEQNLQTELQSKRSRIEEVYRNPYPSLKCQPQKMGSETPLLASDQFNAPSYNIKACTNSKLDNGLFFAPELSNNSGEKILEKMMIESLRDFEDMPPPKRVVKNNSLVVKANLTEYIPKNSYEKHIEPSKTRFPKMDIIPFNRYSPRKDESSTTEYSTDATTDLDAEAPPLNKERRQGAKRKKKELETLVAMTPLLEPRDDASPITTWGEVSNTPMALGISNDVSSTPFFLSAESIREKAAKGAEEKLAVQRARISSASRKSHCSTETPLMNRITNLTPAARALLQKSSSTKHSSVRSSSAFSKALQQSYTPKRRKSVSKSSSSQTTPLTSQEKSKTTDTQVSGHLTDGLLNIPS